jgi:hypothetical protein
LNLIPFFVFATLTPARYKLVYTEIKKKDTLPWESMKFMPSVAPIHILLEDM